MKVIAFPMQGLADAPRSAEPAAAMQEAFASVFEQIQAFAARSSSAPGQETAPGLADQRADAADRKVKPRLPVEPAKKRLDAAAIPVASAAATRSEAASLARQEEKSARRSAEADPASASTKKPEKTEPGKEESGENPQEAGRAPAASRPENAPQKTAGEQVSLEPEEEPVVLELSAAPAESDSEDAGDSAQDRENLFPQAGAPAASGGQGSGAEKTVAEPPRLVMPMTEGAQTRPAGFSEPVTAKITVAEPAASAPLPGAGEDSADQGQNSRIADQAVRALKSVVNQRGGTLTLRLNPPELGQMRVRVDLQAGGVRAQFEVASEQVRQALQQQLHQLRSALEQQGLWVDRLQVQTAPAGGAFLQDGSAQSQDEGRSRGWFEQESPQQGGQGSAEQNRRDRTQSFRQELLDLVA